MIPPGESYVEVFRRATADVDFEKLSPADRVNTILSVKSPHDVRFLSQFMEQDVRLHEIKKLSSKTSTAVFKFKVERFYCNGSGNLHGGAQASIYDVLTSLTVQAIGTPNFWLNGGVSRNLDVTFLRPGPEGVDVVCEVEVMQTGERTSFHRATMKREDNGALISVAKHDKISVPTKPGWDAPSKL